MLSFNWASLKASTRRAVHDTFKVNALYQDAFMSQPLAVSVRWHNKIGVVGQDTNDGYAEVIEGVDRLIFNREELQRLAHVTDNNQPLYPTKGGKVKLTDPLFNGAVLVLDTKEPTTGPVDEVWNVTRYQ